MINHKKKYINRELSWLAFNYSILKEACRKNHPLYERIKFLAIYSSNLDEFYRIKVGALQKLKQVDKKNVKVHLGFSPKKTIKEIAKECKVQNEEFNSIFENEILPELKKNDINLWQNEQLNDVQANYLKSLFKTKILSYLHPEFLSEKLPLKSLHLNNPFFIVRLKGPERIEFARINIPSDKIKRFFSLPSNGKNDTFIFLDDILRMHIRYVFPKHEVLDVHSYVINHDESINIEDEYSGNLVEKISDQLKSSIKGLPTRLTYDKEMPEDLLKALMKIHGVKVAELVENSRYQNLFDLMTLTNPLKPKLEFEKWSPLCHNELESHDSIFDAIDKKDRLLHFPYQQFNYVLRFFNEAAIDPDVTEIWLTLYRIAKNSLIANALINAAKRGKKIVVFIEVKASTDEAHNLFWAKEMENAGVKLIYSLPGLKVHAKMALVRRNTGDIEKQYAYLGTGNFNETTSKIYSDIGIFTSREKLTKEVHTVFDFLYRKRPIEKLKYLFVSQYNLKNKLIRLIDKEINNAKEGLEAEIIIKLNNLEDHDMIDKLYEAGQAGVKVHLVVRGICCLNPQLNGHSENITVTRILGRYLEHSRILVFHQKGKKQVYLTSADWMQRNLYKRIEIAFPVYDKKIKSNLLEYLDCQLQSNGVASDAEIATKKTEMVQKDIYDWLALNS